MAKKIWVNIEGGDPTKSEGRVVQFDINATETKPGSAKGVDVFVFGEPDGGNEDATYMGAAHRGQNFQTDPPYCTKVTLVGTKTPAKVQISIAGGDKWGFKVSKKADASGAKKKPGDPYEAWRKIYVQVGHMADCSSVDPTSLNGKLAKLFIEIEKVGAMRELPHAGTSPEIVPPMSALGKAAGAPPHPAITVRVVFVDRIIRPGDLKWDFDFTPSMLSKGRQMKIKVKDDKLSWPFDDWLQSGKIYLFDGKGARMAEDPIQNFVSRTKAGKGSSGRSYEHKEGLVTNRLLFDFKKFPNIERWMAEKGGKGKIFIGMRNIESSAGGLAHPTSPWVTVASRSGWFYKKRKDMPQILLHELGHITGNVLRHIPRFTADTGVSDDSDENSMWYDKHGGVGNHCHSGSTLKADTCEAGPGACVMFHSTGGGGNDFCDSCQKILKRAPLSKLGRVNVWGDAGWA